MVSYLQIEDLTKSYGDRVLFENITFGINEGDKIGIVAKNGTGKSTLLKIITGKETPDSGSVIFRNDLKVGFLPQIPEFNPNDTVLDTCLSGDTLKLEAIRQYESALCSGDTEEINTASHLMDSADAWNHEDRLRQLLSRFHITDMSAQIGHLSGGQRKRVALAKIIIESPELLILDEPTNHLDIEIIEWLEQYLQRSKVTLLMVTHDRYFLDRVCNTILELDMRNAYIHNGNFDYYLRRKKERIEAMENNLLKIKNTLRREQEWMSRQPQARAGKAKYRIDAFYELKEKSRVNLNESNVDLNINSSYLGSKIAVAKNISKSFGEKLILDDFSYSFARYEKIGIVGNNGVGKTTFIKTLLGEIKPDSGEWEIGETIRFGYYNQDGIAFNKEKKVIDAVSEIADDIILDDGKRFSASQFLKKFLFEPADQQKYIHTLSGGELCRLHLATVLMRSPNFLILDEPTNDLDIVTLGLLEEYLRDFKGCVIIISHDRFFLDSIVDHIFVLNGDGIVRDFPGNYTDYRNYRAEQEREQKKAIEKKSDSANQSKKHADKKNRLTFKQQKEFDSLSEDINSLNDEIKLIEDMFSSGVEIENISELSSKYESLKKVLSEKEDQWLELAMLTED